MLATLKVTPNVDNYKKPVCTWQDNERNKQSLWNKFLKKKKKNVHSDLYQQYAFYDNNMYRLSTLGLSLYPKENEHLQLFMGFTELKKESQLYSYLLDRINCLGGATALTPSLNLFAKGREN